MTAARQQRKRTAGLAPIAAWRRRRRSAAASWPRRARGATEQVVIDRHTGLAISGFDPVAYFTDGAPVEGRARSNARFAGAVWRFRNERQPRGLRSPIPRSITPRFGGYDPVGGRARRRGAGQPAAVAHRRASGSICSSRRRARRPSPPTATASSPTAERPMAERARHARAVSSRLTSAVHRRAPPGRPRR